MRTHSKHAQTVGEIVRLVVLLLGIACINQPSWAAPPASYSAKMKGMPDLLQTLGEAEFRGEGSQFCAPVAVSNSLMWLGNHDYPRLLPEDQKDLTSTQIKMVHILASKEMMDVNAVTGTEPERLMQGVMRYVEKCGYRSKSLLYQGWRPVSGRFSSKAQRPNLEWIKSRIANDRSAVWWNVGWYKVGASNGEHERIGGHWLTLVAYRASEKTSERNEAFILHDPAPRAGKSFAREIVLLQEIEEGTLAGPQRGLPQSAIGYYQVGGGMHVKKSADFAILDGVVALELAPQKSNP